MSATDRVKTAVKRRGTGKREGKAGVADQRERENSRTLSAAEQRRKAAFERKKAELEAAGYTEYDLTIGLAQANVLAVVLALPPVILLCAGFVLYNRELPLPFGLLPSLAVLAVFFALIAVHELIHGLTWAHYAPGGWKAVEFGFIREYLTPYCTCSEPLTRGQYVLGALMPTLVLGVLPALIGIFLGSAAVFAVGILLIFGGGGDLALVGKLLCWRSPSSDTRYIDHPYQCGVVAFAGK